MGFQLKYGFISDISPSDGYVRVSFPDDDDGEGAVFVSDWLQVLVKKSQDDKETFPYDINEQVVCMMDEHCEEGVVLGATYNKTDKPDGAGPDIYRTKFKDGSSVTFNRATGDYVADFKGKVDVKAGGDMTVTASAKLKADVTGDVEITTAGKAKVNATGNIEATTSAQAKINALSADIVAPTVNITGNVLITGNLSAANIAASGTLGGGGISAAGGNLSVPGNVLANGSVSALVNLNAAGDVFAGTLGAISLKTHVHGGVQTGGGLTLIAQ